MRSHYGSAPQLESAGCTALEPEVAYTMECNRKTLSNASCDSNANDGLSVSGVQQTSCRTSRLTAAT